MVNLFAKLRIAAVFAWALALALLVPAFFFNYGGRWLCRVAEFWPLTYP